MARSTLRTPTKLSLSGQPTKSCSRHSSPGEGGFPAFSGLGKEHHQMRDGQSCMGGHEGGMDNVHKGFS